MACTCGASASTERPNGWYAVKRYSSSLERTWFDSLDEAEAGAAEMLKRSAAYWGRARAGDAFDVFDARPFEYEVWSTLRDTDAGARELQQLLDIIDRARGAERTS